MKYFYVLWFVPFVFFGQLKTGAKAEYNKAKIVLMHQPEDELFYGVIHPNAALFDTYFDRDLAKKEHQQFQEVLHQNGVDVFTVRQILLKNTLDESNQPKYGKDLLELQKFARSCVKIDTISQTYLGEEEYAYQQAYLDRVFAKMHPNDLVKTILLQPVLTLKKTQTNTYIAADYNVFPVMNLYFTRDQMITTGKGVVLTSLNSPQRAIETKILRFCLKKLGVPLLLDVSDPACEDCFLEGGDFLMFGNTALIGQGMRTNSKAIKTLMQQDVLGTKYVAVVKDRYFYQPQMHLDTYFNIIDKDLVAISENRYHAKSSGKEGLSVDLYEKKKGGYSLKKQNIPFKEYLEDYLKVTVFVLSEQDQKNYGLNFLCIGPREIVAVKGQSESYIQKMKQHKVKIHWVDFTNLKQGWGAAHCTTQVVFREE